MIRPLLLVLLLLVPAHGGETAWAPCGLVPGERYWITRDGLVMPDGTVLEGWHLCDIPEGVILSIAVNERHDPVATVVVHPACAPASNEEALLGTMREDAIAYAKANGFPDERITLEQGACTTPRSVDLKVR